MFMDAFFGYNQILMSEEDQEKTPLVTSQRFVLLQSHALQSEECRNYMPEAGKSHVQQADRQKRKSLCGQHARKGHLNDLQDTLNTLRRYQIKLNLAKCVFGVSQGRIKANPKKVKAILHMASPKNSKGGTKINRMNCGFKQVHL